jgi:hypothetical protein
METHGSSSCRTGMFADVEGVGNLMPLFAPENLAHVFLTKMAGQSASGDLDGTQ